jgi:hypothetical protein
MDRGIGGNENEIKKSKRTGPAPKQICWLSHPDFEVTGRSWL